MGNSRGAGQRNHNEAARTAITMMADGSQDGRDAKRNVKSDSDMEKLTS
jgi:hypothetical protein